MTTRDYTAVTEIAGEAVSVEQVDRMSRRYGWAGGYCSGKDVLEVACGAGQGLGYLASVSRSLHAGDFSLPLLRVAKSHYGARIPLSRFDAQQLPFREGCFDVIVLFEALYYLPDVEAFFTEAHRVLREDGVLLLATANKDLYDFNPSPHSHRYLGVQELASELSAVGFDVRCFGDTPVTDVSLRQRMLRPLKAFASRLGLVPRSMRAKRWLKRVVFGGLVAMPAELRPEPSDADGPAPVSLEEPDRIHKVILCAARRL